LSDEYCDESAPPKYWLQVENDFSAAGARTPPARSNREIFNVCMDAAP
jgi:hypothetical protein